MTYTANAKRYDTMQYRRCGKTGLKLPIISLGFWQSSTEYDFVNEISLAAFDNGITHFDLANNYGPPAGAAELAFGKVLNRNLASYRDEIIVTTKAGYDMWEGPYGDFGSKKYIAASIDQSLTRLGLDYVDVLYHHRPDAETPLEETIGALAQIVQQGKALYAGISNYYGDDIIKAKQLAKEYELPLIANQVSYSMLERRPEKEVLPICAQNGMGIVAFSPLRQGLLTDRYLNTVEDNSRAARDSGLRNQLTPTMKELLIQLNAIANENNITLAQLALLWILKKPEITSVIVGASKVSQLQSNLAIVNSSPISDADVMRIAALLGE